jgi:hypothetical protein
MISGNQESIRAIGKRKAIYFLPKEGFSRNMGVKTSEALVSFVPF